MMSALARLGRVVGIMLSSKRKREKELDILEGQFTPVWLEINEWEMELDGRRYGQSDREF